MASAGPRYSTIESSAGDGAATWGSTANVRADDGADSTTSPAVTSNVTDSLRVTGFGFTVPTGSVIRGVVAEMEMYQTGANATTAIRFAKLIKGGVFSSDSKLAAQDLATAPGSTFTAGSSTDLWGLSLTAADVNASDFGVGVQVEVGAGAADGGGCDFIRLTVYYDPPGAAGMFLGML